MTLPLPRLPEGFDALTAFAETWGHLDEQGRIRTRLACEMADLREFYDAAAPLFPSAMSRFSERPTGALSEDEQLLLNIMLGLIEVSFSVEVYGENAPSWVFDASRVRTDVRLTRPV